MVLKDRVRQLRQLFVPVDPAQRTDYLPGELAQCESLSPCGSEVEPWLSTTSRFLWFPTADVPLGRPLGGHYAQATADSGCSAAGACQGEGVGGNRGIESAIGRT